MPFVRRARRGEIDLFKVGLLLVAVSIVYWGVAFVPHYWVAVKMDEVVTLTTLEWRDKSKEKAIGRLDIELDKKEIPVYVLPGDCEFYEQEGRRHVDCYWAVDVKWLIVDKRTTLEFYVGKYLDGRDVLHDIDELGTPLG
jgi:hypothetical protein